MNESLVFFLQDFSKLLFERAIVARDQCQRMHIVDTDAYEAGFECGRALAYYEAVALLIHQAIVFNIPNDIIDQTVINPDELLNE